MNKKSKTKTDKKNDKKTFSNSNKKNVYWFQDLGILTDIDKLSEFLPNTNMSYPEKINSLVRLSWYIGLILAVVNTNYLYLYIPVITMFVTFIVYCFREDTQKELFQNNELSESEKLHILNNLENKISNSLKNNNINNSPHNISNSVLDNNLNNKYKIQNNDNCTNPDIENPFMNAMPYDSRNRNPACNLQKNPFKQVEVDVLYDEGTYRDVNNIFDRNTGKRQFFTMPWTTYPNDQGTFANWLYKRAPTCKEGNGAQCVANQYTPLSRYNLITPARGSIP